MTLSRCLTVRVFAVLLLLASLSAHLSAQSADARVTGIVTDPSKAVLRGARILAINTDTSVRYAAVTNSSGIYSLFSLPAGHYRLEVESRGFKSVVMPGVTLHVQDVDEINFDLAVGSMSETVTVEGDSVQINTTNAAVSTVIDQKLIGELPLNGRSLDTLFLLTPGVVPTSQSNGGPGTGGGYSINGQRGSANNLTVDGASGNFYLSVNSQHGFAGSNYAQSSSGGTNGLLPVDAIEEYRIQTSSYSAEFGRSPGGQIQIRSRGGTNIFHGSLYEYFRNQVLDATDWFVKYNNEKQAPLRMNDFGGTFGGPIWKDKLFFFAATENLLLDQPESASVGVPSALARQSTSNAFQQFIAGYPSGNGGTATTAQYPQYTDTYNESYTTQIADHSVGARFDLHLPKETALFYRFDIAPSHTYINGIGAGNTTENIATHTVGLTNAFTSHISNELTFNYSTSSSTLSAELLPIGGSDPSSTVSFCNGQPGPSHLCVIQPLKGWTNLELGNSGNNHLDQFNIIDALRWHTHRHVMAFGADFRRLPTYIGKTTEYLARPAYTKGPASLTGTTLDQASVFSYSQANLTLPVINLSLFAQDEWHLTNRMSLSYGVRWEYNPPISDGHGGPLAITGDVNNPATLAPAPTYTPLYGATYGNFAPRVGAAYQLRQKPNFSTVLRAGWGVFYDTGQSSTTAADVSNSYPYSLSVSQSNIPISSLNFQGMLQNAAKLTLPQGSLVVTDPRLRLPYTFQWNVALEQELYGKSSISATYLAAAGEKLASTLTYNASPSPLLSTGELEILTNNGLSNYQALQLQSVTRAGGMLDAIFSYSYAHEIDNGSSDFYGPAGGSRSYRGNGDDDIRHAFSAGVSLKSTGISRNAFLKAITHDWILNTFTRLQTASPLSAKANVYTSDAAVENQLNGFANVVPGVPVYLRGGSAGACAATKSCIPGGVQLNPAAFTQPLEDAKGNTLSDGDSPRNAYRLFGLKQFDLSAGRSVKIRENATFTFKAEMFNILNTPNFGDVQTFLGNPNFGQAENTYAGSTSGSGGLNQVFQLGGPRNVQFTARIAF